MPDTVSIPSAVAEAFTDAWCDTVITSDIAASLGCTEVDTLINLLHALNADQSAAEWIAAHAQDDEPDNRRFQGIVPADAALATDGMHWSPAASDERHRA
ncbi:hypothetical protein [Streptomyces canus]|uniref:hypothetical protein n=1 Tax=Streptomyces canus TaxID=58343 RepID=UPI002E27DA32|nr:hypothetical protein [Streptomyces canus]